MRKMVLIILIIFYIFSGTSIAIQYTYDNLNRLVSAEYDNGSTIEYQYDGAGNRTQRVIKAQTCYGGLSDDGDIDGSDLASYIAGGAFADIPLFANSFGRSDCP